jgi:DNA repair protein RadA/Sms
MHTPCNNSASPVVTSRSPISLAVGEIGLGGELRQVAHLDRRLHEAARMGFRRAIVPPGTELSVDGLQLLRAPTLAAAIALADVAPT